ncbi:hypothetical protein BSKO_03845 [Bryopsis sp. KO-2023]|nr:hypothetical protein BSKO_03845 [Bryopsis sp. KO-2023]
MAPPNIAALLILGIVSSGGVGTVAGQSQFSFRYDDGLCREITSENAASCCVDDPLPPAGPFPGKLVIGIGPRKTGTTYLYSLLQDHPDIKVPGRELKELHFFSTRRSRLDRDSKNGTLEEYMSYWDLKDTSESTVFMEVSADYFRDPAAPCRLKRMAPHAKILVNFRDPAARALSLTQMLRMQCVQDKAKNTFRINELYPKVCCTVAKPFHCLFEEAKEEIRQTPGCDFQSGVARKNWMECAHREYVHDPIHSGHYAAITAWWFEFFPPENFLFMRLEEDLMADPLKQANRVLDFIGITTPLEKIPETNANSGQYTWVEPFLKPTLRQMQVYFSRPNTELIMFLQSQGHDLGLMNLETPRESAGSIPLPVDCPYKGDLGEFDHHDMPQHNSLDFLKETVELKVQNCEVSDFPCCDDLKESFYRLTELYKRRHGWGLLKYYQKLCVVAVAGVYFIYVYRSQPRLVKFWFDAVRSRLMRFRRPI